MKHTFSSPDASDTIRVMAVDSTPMNSQLLAEALSKYKYLAVSQGTPDQTQIVAAVGTENPHVLLLSANLANDDEAGFKVAQSVRAQAPQTKLVILLDSSEARLVLEAFRCGVRGVFSRAGSLEALAKCVHSVHQGQIWANSSELGFLVDACSTAPAGQNLDAAAMPKLTKREGEVVRCIVEGLSNREIAARLTLTEHTVKNYLFRIFDKLGVSSRLELVLCALSFTQSSPRAGRNSVLEMRPGSSSEYKRSVSSNLMRSESYRARG